MKELNRSQFENDPEKDDPCVSSKSFTEGSKHPETRLLKYLDPKEPPVDESKEFLPNASQAFQSIWLKMTHAIDNGIDNLPTSQRDEVQTSPQKLVDMPGATPNQYEEDSLIKAKLAEANLRRMQTPVIILSNQEELEGKDLTCI